MTDYRPIMFRCYLMSTCLYVLIALSPIVLPGPRSANMGIASALLTVAGIGFVVNVLVGIPLLWLLRIRGEHWPFVILWIVSCVAAVYFVLSL